jgi:hypothetical protein
LAKLKENDMRKGHLITGCALALTVFGGAALAQDAGADRQSAERAGRPERVERPERADRPDRGDRVERRLDRQGDIADRRFDRRQDRRN